ncbi:MAG TPA: oligosaccharide flippase family protein [Kofleriaceae bacterium]
MPDEVTEKPEVVTEAPSPAAQAPSSAARGVIYIAFAKFYFMVAGMVLQFRLPHILSRAAWGSYSLVTNVTSLVNNVLVTGTIQSVSKYSAQEPDKVRRVQQAGLRMHVRFGLVIAIGFIAAAPLVAHFMHDSTKTAPLMMAGLILGGNAFYAVFVGTANGMQQFHKQAGFDITFSTLRTVALLGTAMLGLGVVQVISGWVAAVFAILCIAIVAVGLPGKIAKEDRLPIAPMMKFFGGVAIYLFLFNALMFVDSLLIKRLTTEYFAAHANEMNAAIGANIGWAVNATGYKLNPSVLADVQNGYYAAAQNLGRLSYQAIIAATFVVFPLVSRSTFTDDKETTRRYVQVTTRYSLIFAMAIAVCFAANPEEMLGVIYPADIAHLGGPALPWLAFGNVAFSVFAIAGTILNGAGYTRDAIISALITLLIAIVGNYIAIPLAAEANRTLEVAAMVTGAAMVIGAVITGLMLVRRLGAFLPLVSIARIGIATVAAFVVGHFLPLHGKLMSLVEACIVGGVFLVVLVATKELGKRDLEAIKAVRRKRAREGDTA